MSVEEKTKYKKNTDGANLGFEEKLWSAADMLRGHIDASDYKYVVLGLIFLKYLSDIFEEFSYSLRKKGIINQDNRTSYIDANIFWVPEKARWSFLVSNAENSNIGNLIDNAMELIEAENPALKDVLNKDYSRPTLDKQRIGELVKLVNTIGLGDTESRANDVLGRVYEYFLGKFASSEGNTGGEFYTPPSVVKLLVEMLAPYKGKVYDPCCGSGGMFIQSEKFVKAHGGSTEDISIYGQESNHTTWRLCKMNLAMRGIQAEFGSGPADSFRNDLHKDLKADFIIANPPFNMSEWGGNKLRHDTRWKYGIPPASNANFAWVQHIIYHLAPNGVAGFVLSNGALSASQGKDNGNIRKGLIDADLIDCIVALPTNLFYNTQIAASLWFITPNKNNPKQRDRRGQTLYIYAYHLGIYVDRIHKELSVTDINLIASVYHVWREEPSLYKDIPGFCKSVTIDEMKAHKMALVPGRYVGFDQASSEFWDDSKLRAELAQVEVRINEINQSSETAMSILRRLIYG
jgi:type I restriction enzyme M protein